MENIIKLEEVRDKRDFTKQLEELKEKPFIDLHGELVNNYAIDKESNGAIFVKYCKMMNRYTVEIEAEDIAEVKEIINAVKCMQKIKKIRG